MGLSDRIDSFYEDLSSWHTILKHSRWHRRSQETQRRVVNAANKTKEKLDTYKEAVNRQGYDADSRRRIGWALNAMYETHSGEERLNGLPYPHHPLHVSYQLIEYLEPETSDLVVDTLLHDVIEAKGDEAATRIETVLGQSTRRRIDYLSTSSWPDKRHRLVRDVLGSVVPRDGLDAVIANLEYYDVVTPKITSNDKTLFAKAFDFADNAFYLDELSGHKAFRRRVANKYLPLITTFLDEFKDVDTEAIRVSQRGVQSITRTFQENYAGVKRLAQRWQYHDIQQTLLDADNQDTPRWKALVNKHGGRSYDVSTGSQA